MTSRRHTIRWVAVGAVTIGALALLVGLVPALLPGLVPGTGRGPAAPDRAFPGGETVAFYGDSYTLGTGASAPERRWSTIVSTERGWNEVNPSANGLGFVNNRAGRPGGDVVDQVIAAEPDIVFVTMGLNDNFSMPARSDDIREAITRDFTTLTTALPDARLIVVEPFWYTDDRPPSVDQIIDWVKADAARIDADYISGASRWIEGHPEWMADDGLHPNDEGYRAIAERMDAELDKLGL